MFALLLSLSPPASRLLASRVSRSAAVAGAVPRDVGARCVRSVPSTGSAVSTAGARRMLANAASRSARRAGMRRCAAQRSGAGAAPRPSAVPPPLAAKLPNKPFRWSWAVVGGAILVGAVFPATNFFIVQELKATGPYKAAMSAVERDPRVRDALGIPIMVGSVYSVSGVRKGNKFQLTVHLKGPKGSATAKGRFTFVNQEGMIDRLVVDVDGTGERIDLA